MVPWFESLGHLHTKGTTVACHAQIQLLAQLGQLQVLRFLPALDTAGNVLQNTHAAAACHCFQGLLSDWFVVQVR